MSRAVLYFRPTKPSPKAAQRRLAKRFVEVNGLEVTAEFTDRVGTKGYPALEKAIEAARGQLLILTNVGRLVKGVKFTRMLLGADEFVALDDPNFDSETIHILAAVAAEDSVRASRRTRDTMTKLRAQGVKLGSHRPGHTYGKEALLKNKTGPKIAARLRTERTLDYYAFIMPRIVEMRKRRVSYVAIADALNEDGLVTQVGKPFTVTAVLRLIRRYEEATGEKLPCNPPGRPKRAEKPCPN